MSTKREYNALAARHASSLSQVILKLRRSKEGAIAGLLHQADMHLNGYKRAKRSAMLPPVTGITEKIEHQIQDDLLAPMASLGDVIKDTIKPLCFALLVFGDGPDGRQRMNYTANAVLADVVEALREFVTTYDRSQGDPDE